MTKEQAFAVAEQVNNYPHDFKSATIVKAPSTGAGSDSIVLAFDNKNKVTIAANGSCKYTTVVTTPVESF